MSTAATARPIPRVLRADGRLHRLDLAKTEHYPIHLTRAAIVALGALEQRLTGETDPATMAPARAQPRVEALYRLADGGWIVAYRLAGWPGRAGAIRYREIPPETGEAIAGACGHAVEPVLPVADNDEQPEPTPAPGGKFAAIIGAATAELAAGRIPNIAIVAKRAGLCRQALYATDEGRRAIDLVKRMAHTASHDRFNAAQERHKGDPLPHLAGGGRRVVRKSIEGEQQDDDDE